MSLATLFRGITRGTTDEKSAEVNKFGSLYVAHHLPRYAALVNEGVCWEAGEAVDVIAVAAIPSTTAQITLYNNEPEGGKTYVMLSVYGFQEVKAATLDSWGIFHAISQIKAVTLPAADIAAIDIRPLKANQGAYGGRARIDLAATLDVNPLWKSIGNSITNSAGALLTGTQIEVLLEGMVILPPGGEYSLVAVASVATVQTRLGFRWAEVQL